MTEKNLDEKLVIVVTKPHGFELPPVSSKLAEEKAGLMLIPGENSVTRGCWEQVQANPAVKIHLRAGTLQNMGTGVAVPITTDWSKVSVDQARKLVKSVKKTETLQDIKKATNKKKIAQICDERVEEILAENEKRNR